MGIMRPKTPKGPSQKEIQAAQERAAERERQRLEKEQAAKEAETKQKAEAELKARESKRQAFATGIAANDEDERKRYLGGR